MMVFRWALLWEQTVAWFRFRSSHSDINTMSQNNQNSNSNSHYHFSLHSMAQPSSSSSHDAFLGTTWSAPQAIQALERGELRSLEQNNCRMRLLMECVGNANNAAFDDDLNDLIYSWITPSGRIACFRPFKTSTSTDATSTKAHVEQTFTGHAFLFAKLKHTEDAKIDLDQLTSWQDVDILGAYRPERLFGDSNDNDNDDFCCHKLTLELVSSSSSPPSCMTRLWKKCCSRRLGPFLRTRQSLDSKKQDDPVATQSNFNNADTNADVDIDLEQQQQQPLTATATKTQHLHPNPDSPLEPPSKRTRPRDETWRICVRQYHIDPSRCIDTTTTKCYTATTLCDWPCQLEDGCFENDTTTAIIDNNKAQQIHDPYDLEAQSQQQQQQSQPLDYRQLFCQDLRYALDHFPPAALQQLKDRGCCFWINKSFEYGPVHSPETLTNMCFHPDVAWLHKHQMHTAKQHCVEIYNVAHYFGHDRAYWGTGGVLIHELSHAYHNLCLEQGYDNPDILQCYQQAMDESLYNSVAVHGPQGPTARAYACDNHMEYFAELSTAFLGGLKSSEEYNKWYPFNRQQLKQHDPRAFALLQRVWQVQVE